MLAIVISYLPVLYQSFSRREATALLMDARAGSPPTAGELLRRFDGADYDGLERLLEEYERWCASLLESFLSYPVLAMYRAQHEKLSWLACLTAILDSTALIQTSFCDNTKECCALRKQAELTFAIARHLAVDLAYILNVEPRSPKSDRLPKEEWERLLSLLTNSGNVMDPSAYERLREIRAEYEPYVSELSRSLILAMPGWLPDAKARDSWQTTAWDAVKHF
jgi:hypothetical protein